jgi:hypothetical protein
MEFMWAEVLADVDVLEFFGELSGNAIHKVKGKMHHGFFQLPLAVCQVQVTDMKSYIARKRAYVLLPYFNLRMRI